MLNRVVLMGRLAADPELRQTQSGVSVATFRVAVERDYAPKGGERTADFIPCVAWRQTGEFIAKYFQKGRMIALEGSLQARSYEDRQGQKRTVYEIIVERAYFCGDQTRPDGLSQQQSLGAGRHGPAAGTPADEIPERGASQGGWSAGLQTLDRIQSAASAAGVGSRLPESFGEAEAGDEEYLLF